MAALELERAGFVPQAGYTISCGRVVLNLLRHSPALLRYHLNRAHQAGRAKALADRVYGCSTHAALATAVPRARSSRPSAGFAAALFTGALWTASRMIEAGYLVGGGRCVLCSSGEDTVYHRIWMCAASADARSTHPTALSALRAMELSGRARPMRFAHVAATRGIIPDLAGDIGAAQHEMHLCRMGGDLVESAWVRLHTDRIYTDGSCQQDRATGKPRAGFAIVALGPSGALRAVVHGCVPAHLPQSAAAAEAWAAVRAIELCGGVVRFGTDCAAVVAALAEPMRAAEPKKTMGGGLPARSLAHRQRHGYCVQGAWAHRTR